MDIVHGDVTMPNIMLRTRQEIMDAVVAVLSAHPEVACCYLFGSVADDTFTDASDVDVALALNEPMTPMAKLAFHEALSRGTERDVDVLDLQNAHGTILRRALHGECLIGRDSSERAELIRRHIYDQEDMQPMRRRIMQQRRERFIHG